MTVGLILAEKGTDVITIDGGCTLAEAVQVLGNRRVGALMVTLDGNPVAGMLSERDIVCALSTHDASVLDDMISEYMTRKIITIGMKTTVIEAMEIMTEKRVRHLPVIEDGKLRGLVSIGDIVKRRISDSEAEAEALKEYITTG